MHWRCVPHVALHVVLHMAPSSNPSTPPPLTFISGWNYELSVVVNCVWLHACVIFLAFTPSQSSVIYKHVTCVFFLCYLPHLLQANPTLSPSPLFVRGVLEPSIRTLSTQYNTHTGLCFETILLWPLCWHSISIFCDGDKLRVHCWYVWGIVKRGCYVLWCTCLVMVYKPVSLFLVGSQTWTRLI